MLNLACDAVLFYNVYCRLTFLVDGSWSIRDLESNVLYNGFDTLDQFGGQLEVWTLESVELAPEAG